MPKIWAEIREYNRAFPEMSNREMAMEFLKCFCAGDIDGLAPLLADDLRFKGPLHEFNLSGAYLQSLRDDPPDKCSYRVLSLTQAADHVSIYYDYEKDDGALTVAQLFGFANGKISEILLVFDSRGFG